MKPKPTPVTPSNASSPAFGTQITTGAHIPNQELSRSRLPPLPNPDLTGRTPGEQAVIVALQAVANYPESSDFVRAVRQRVPGLAAYLQATAQPSGCESPTTSIRVSPMEAEATAVTDEATTTSSNDEVGRKRVTQEITTPLSANSITESPTSRPPPTKSELMLQDLR